MTLGVWKPFFTISCFNSYLPLLILIAYSLNCVPKIFSKKQNRFKRFHINLVEKSVGRLIPELLWLCALITSSVPKFLGPVLLAYENRCARTKLGRLALCWRSPDFRPAVISSFKY